MLRVTQRRRALRLATAAKKKWRKTLWKME